GVHTLLARNASDVESLGTDRGVGSPPKRDKLVDPITECL
uniref:Uncharacterized protein n=1 Tax=Amphimedon queenslandica TaxID=400682 RepID=A0A1X7VDS1_AMPQE